MNNNFPPSPSGFGSGGPNGAPPQQQPAPAKGKSSRRGSSKKTKQPKPPTRKIVTNMRGLAIIAAVVAFIAVFFVVNREDPKTFVVRANAPIAQFALAADGQLEAVEVDPDAVEKNAYTGATEEEAKDNAWEDIQGKRFQYPVQDGQQINSEMFTVEASLPEDLAADERLLSISAIASTSVSGNIRAGDHVDLIAVGDIGSGVNSRVILSDVTVAAVSLSNSQLENIASEQADPTSDNYSKGVGELTPSNPIPGTYVLRLTEADTVRIAAVDGDPSMEFYIAYRGAEATTSIDDNRASSQEVLGGISAQ